MVASDLLDWELGDAEEHRLRWRLLIEGLLAVMKLPQMARGTNVSDLSLNSNTLAAEWGTYSEMLSQSQVLDSGRGPK